MKQCVLRKKNRYQVAWIPAKFARAGAFIRILDDDGWRVETVGMYQETVEAAHGYFAGGISHQG